MTTDEYLLSMRACLAILEDSQLPHLEAGISIIKKAIKNTVEFPETLAKAQSAMKDAANYWKCHRNEIRHEGCRGYVVVVCARGSDCPWKCKQQT